MADATSNATPGLTTVRQLDRPLLEVDRVNVRFGGVIALDGPSFAVPAGQICGLIGPNGAGKTTLFNAISGLCAGEGAIRLADQDLLGLKPHEVADRGVARTFQNLGLFHRLSVLDNVVAGAQARRGIRLGASALRLPSVRRQAREDLDLARDLVHQLHLEEVAHHPADGLPYGTLKRVELARALASRPVLLLLDEPATGLAQGEVDALGDVITEARRSHDLTILLVEHHMGMVMRISDRVVVLDFGQKIADGVPDVVRRDPAVIKAYLGAAA